MDRTLRWAHAVAALAALLVLPAVSPSPPADPPAVERIAVEDSGRELGTTYDVVVVVPTARVERAHADLAAARALCHELEAVFSEYRADSELMRLNARAGEQRVEVSEPLRQVLTASWHAAQVSGGAFDPTWRPLGILWDEAERSGLAPTGEALAAALTVVGWQHVDIGADGVLFTQPGVQLGLDGVAKGYIIDAVFGALVERGYPDLIVNIGGDLRTAGRSADGSPWTFRVVDPLDPQRIAAEFELADTAVATSGNYFRRRQVGDREVGHILDPRTGHPPAFEGSVTVLTPGAATADALSTALFVLGPEIGLTLARETDGLDAIFVSSAGTSSTISLEQKE